MLSPAKVNLYLKVLSKRPDGYHNLVSIVDIISIYDVIRIEDNPDGTIVVGDDADRLPRDSGNTMFRAAMLLKETFRVREGVRIHVEKRIPVGAGLGGPSTDAATVLKALRERWKLPVTDEELAFLGARIGADVPLFLYGKPCVMRGIGEEITPISLPRIWYVVVYPGVALSTKEVYGRLRIPLTSGGNDIKLRSGFRTAAEIASILENDLEKPGIAMCPKIQAAKDRLREAGAVGTLMSGSGSSVFGLFETEEEASQASVFMTDIGMGGVFVAHST